MFQYFLDFDIIRFGWKCCQLYNCYVNLFGVFGMVINNIVGEVGDCFVVVFLFMQIVDFVLGMLLQFEFNFVFVFF